MHDRPLASAIETLISLQNTADMLTSFRPFLNPGTHGNGAKRTPQKSQINHLKGSSAVGANDDVSGVGGGIGESQEGFNKHDNYNNHRNNEPNNPKSHSNSHLNNNNNNSQIHDNDDDEDTTTEKINKKLNFDEGSENQVANTIRGLQSTWKTVTLAATHGH